MAFLKNNLSGGIESGGGTKVWYYYHDTDTITTILGANYFNENFRRFKEGDIILVTSAGTPKIASMIKVTTVDRGNNITGTITVDYADMIPSTTNNADKIIVDDTNLIAKLLGQTDLQTIIEILDSYDIDIPLASATSADFFQITDNVGTPLLKIYGDGTIEGNADSMSVTAGTTNLLGVTDIASVVSTIDNLEILTRYKEENLFAYSEQFDNAYWAKTAITISADTGATTDPLGGNTADKIVESATNNLHFINRSISFVTGEYYTLSCYIKAAERTKAYLQLNPGFNAIGTFNLSTGTVISEANGTASISDEGNGWYRCNITAQSTITGASSFNDILILNDNEDTVYLGDGTSGFYIWGASLTKSSSLLPYVATTTEPISRYNLPSDIITPNLRLTNLGTYADNATALAGGLVANDTYKTATGELRIVI